MFCCPAVDILICLQWRMFGVFDNDCNRVEKVKRFKNKKKNRERGIESSGGGQEERKKEGLVFDDTMTLRSLAY